MIVTNVRRDIQRHSPILRKRIPSEILRRLPPSPSMLIGLLVFCFVWSLLVLVQLSTLPWLSSHSPSAIDPFFPTLVSDACSSGKQNEDVCCASSCHKCGGHGCGSQYPGSKEDCCLSFIRHTNRYCNDDGEGSVSPPCLIKKPATIATHLAADLADADADANTYATVSNDINSERTNNSVSTNATTGGSDAICSSGKQSGDVCCSSKCTVCGGEGCGRYKDDCCLSFIRKANRYCDEKNNIFPPCLLKKEVTETTTKNIITTVTNNDENRSGSSSSNNNTGLIATEAKPAAATSSSNNDKAIKQPLTFGELRRMETSPPRSKAHYFCNATQQPYDSNETLWIAMPAWNNVLGLQRSLDSVLDQQEHGFGNIHVVVFEDYTNDATQMMTLEQQKQYQNHNDQMQVTFLRQNTTTKELGQQQNQRMGSAFGKWTIFHHILTHGKVLPHEYILILDGDDVLSDSNALRDAHKQLAKHKPWFAWGRHNGKFSEQCQDLEFQKKRGRRKLNTNTMIRRDAIRWSFCHPRFFQAHLLRELEPRELQRDNGEWLQKATDRGFIFRFLEMAASQDRILFLKDRPLYNYTFDQQRNGLKVFSQKVIAGDKELVNQRPAVARSSDTIHIIACVYDRTNTKEFLTRLATSVLHDASDGATNNAATNLRIHICNNKAERQSELVSMSKDIMTNHQSLSSSSNSGTASTAGNVTIDIVDMGGNQRGYSRFVLARQIMKKEFMDYAIMVDDDQHVTASTIAEIYAKRKPQTYQSWYGKTWRPGETSYWKPYPNLSNKAKDRYRQKPRWNMYQYGGAGMSIVDASVFLKEELYQLEERYRFVEDVWLSYIVQTSGWKILRLDLKPFDQPQFEESDQGKRLMESSQFSKEGMKTLKDEFFAKVSYLQCDPETVKSVKARLS